MILFYFVIYGNHSCTKISVVTSVIENWITLNTNYRFTSVSYNYMNESMYDIDWYLVFTNLCSESDWFRMKFFYFKFVILVLAFGSFEDTVAKSKVFLNWNYLTFLIKINFSQRAYIWNDEKDLNQVEKIRPSQPTSYIKCRYQLFSFFFKIEVKSFLISNQLRL